MKKVSKGFISILLLTAHLVGLVACKNDEQNGKPPSDQGELIDYGIIPVTVGGHSEFAENEFQMAAYNNNFVFVATSDGLWKNNLLTKEWTRSGFEGKKVSCVFRHPSIANKLFAGVVPAENSREKSLYISTDDGESWNAAESPVHDDLDNVYETYVCMAVRPNHPDHIYANMKGGTMIAVSLDGGNNWLRMNYEKSSNFGYRSNIIFLPDNADRIFQGSENPLDDAWLGSYDIDGEDPVELKNFTKIVDRDVFSNRRPVELQTHFFSGNSIYVGQEGALSKVTGSTTKFIFKAEEENSKLPYAYIYGVWVDSKDPKHLVFGGAVNGDQTSVSLFETFDEGNHINQFTSDMLPSTSQITKIVATDHYPAIVTYDPITEKVRLLLYKTD